jgi:acetyltransferase-like isoleucine patch superfamily enzyme
LRKLPHEWFPRPLPPNICIGDRSWIYSSFAFLHYRSRRVIGVRVGTDSGIYNGTFFDLGPKGEIQIGNFCAVVGAIFSCNSRVVVEDYTFISHEVVLADHVVATPPLGDDGLSEPDDEPEQPAGDVSISIGANAWIGVRAVLLKGAQIGQGVIVGAGAVVDFAVPPFAIVAGNPARVVGMSAPIPSADR